MGSITEVDYLTQARSRYTQQFKNKPIFDAHINIFITEITEIQDMLQDLIGLRSLETAVGSQLDMIGAIVGQPRVLVDFSLFPFFGFDGATEAQTFGSLYDSALGGTWKSISDAEGASFEVDDDTYRFIIKARIVANISNTTPQGVIDAVNYIVSRDDSSIEEMGNAHLKIIHYASLTPLQEYFLRGLSSIGSIIPLPICVSYEIAVPSNPYTKLLMHFDGADGGTTFTDSSQYARAISRTGTVTTSNIQSKFGGTSLKNLNEGALIIPNSSDFNLGLNDFTIECWVYLLSYNTFNTVLDATNSPSGAIWRFWASYSGSSNKVHFYGVTSSVAVSLNTWTHIAVSRVSGSTRVYVNGVGGTAATLGKIESNNSNIVIGKTDTYGSNMYIDELRVRVGEAVYTSNFTPPTSPFTS